MRPHERKGLLVEYDERTRVPLADHADAPALDSAEAKHRRVTVALWWLIGILLLLAGLEPLVVPNKPPTPDWVKHVHQAAPGGPIKP